MNLLTVGITVHNESMEDVNNSIESIGNIAGLTFTVSVDNNNSLLNEIKDQYPAFNVFGSDSNIGLGESRNKIIKTCETPWLTFLDVGDVLIADVLKQFLEIQNNDIDIYIYQTKKFYKGEFLLTDQLITSKYRLLYKHAYLNFQSSATAKIMNLSFLLKNKIFFDKKNLYHEDLLMMPKLYSEMNRYRIFREPLYLWFVKENTLSTSMNTKKISDLAYIFKKRRKFYMEIEDILDIKFIKKRERLFLFRKIINSRKYYYFFNYLKFIYSDHE